MSDVSQGPDWWQASDGKWYPPSVTPGPTSQRLDDALVGGSHMPETVEPISPRPGTPQATVPLVRGTQRTDVLAFVTTATDLPGCSIESVIGDVSGVSVRTRHIFTVFCIAGRMIIGGEVKSLTKALVAARAQAVKRMSNEAKQRGANAVVGMNVQVSGFSVTASGTAVLIR